ncbi:hypothetical protein BBJ29_007223 [Phytophthora kernoviae]|uniref:Uncharacterized protein n=1 Tax=Phytophthora kernoviae TaxID=325452 RepID=A0A3F2RPN2_9STRA|nr:hypothetical protein BBJ29_007223 [Phytophthora kernoviae]RLN61828.1 hypothetical protein BBP00_00005150 [Phytophthora kernoviae]
MRLQRLPVRFQRRNFSHSSATELATSLRDIARSGSLVRELQLSKSGDLICRQLMCEHVGDACVCRLALALERVPRLQQLILANNQLRALPDVVFALSSLSYLNLKQNRLQALSTDVSKLTELEILDIRDNQLETLPVQALEGMHKLQELKIAGNPTLIRALEAEILNLIQVENWWLDFGQCNAGAGETRTVISAGKTMLGRALAVAEVTRAVPYD